MEYLNVIKNMISKLKSFFIKKKRTDTEELLHNTLLFHAKIYQLKRKRLSRVDATKQAFIEKLNED